MRILHLYPDLMNLYGDYANIDILVRHLKDLGIRVRVDRKEVQDAINFDNYDMIYMGPGTESAQLVALEDLYKYRHILKVFFEQDKVGLFTGNAMELFGQTIDDKKALGLLDFQTAVDDKRYTGDVIAYNELTGPVVGFINCSSKTSGNDTNSLFDIEFADLDIGKKEGYRYRNLFGTHLIGPALVKNPGLLDLIVRLLAGDKYKQLEYVNEMKAYENTLTELRKRK